MDSEGKNRLLVDGIKISYDEPGRHTAILLIPDKEHPLFHINAEAPEVRRARELASEYEHKIVRWRDGTV